jgi:hypothetical protein
MAIRTEAARALLAANAPRVMARGRTTAHRAGTMNKTEARYAAEVLAPQLAAGIILQWEFEAIKLRIGVNCFYTPDFFVMSKNGEISLHECKGYMMDDALVKLRAVAEMWPFPVLLCRIVNGDWEIKEL